MDLLDIARILQIVFGIGLVIFVHELGHFIAARRCGVRVDVFSLGFGPKLLGWTRGDTTYQVALIPLGGYVKMAGEELEGEPRPPADDELGSKTVGQRFFIFAGGVIMNVIFAIIIFPILLMAGVPFIEPMIGAVAPGGAAWMAGLEPGTRVHSVDGQRTRDFERVVTLVALGDGDKIDLEIQRPGETEFEKISIEVPYHEASGMRWFGVGSPVDSDHTLSVKKGSSAYIAGMRSGDRLTGIKDGVPELTLPERVDLAVARSETLNVSVDRDGQTLDFEMAPQMTETERRFFGLALVSRQISRLRQSESMTAVGLQEGDLLLSIGGTAYWGTGLLDKLFALADTPLALLVERNGSKVELNGPALDRNELLAFARQIAFKAEAETTFISVPRGTAAETAGMMTGDKITAVAGAEVETFEDILEATGPAAKDEKALTFAVRREVPGGEPEFLEFKVQPILSAVPNYGFAFEQATYVYQEKNPVRAVTVGLSYCWSFMEDAARMLRGIAKSNVSGKNVGGIITIGVVAHNYANSGWAKLFFFLCMLSMNLAFLNVLPIPLLDGGHLFFLMIEKIKGSPVSERILGYSQLVGLVLILSLFVYVMHNDIQRWVLSGF